MAQDLRSELRLRAGDAAHSTADALGGVIGRRIRDAEQALELQRTFPMIALPGRGAEPVWTTFGPPENVWLVNAAGVGAPVVTAVRAALVIGSLSTPSRVPGNRTVVIGSAADGEPLTPNFLGLAVSLPKEAAAALAAESRLPRSFYLVALALVVSIALFGGHLFWRDVRREVRMADLRSQFVSSVSHELKTPLTAIRMFAETLLLGRARPEVSQEYLETIVNESERLTRLLNTVLDFSKIEQGKKTYRLQPHSPESIIRAAVKALQYPATQQGFDLRVRVDDDVPLINADPDAIEQALHNLVSNAMKYSGDSRVIELALSKDGASAVVSVTDHGIGISPEEHARIFEKFYRVRNHATERIPGTGLGLALVDHVARAHGGRVTVTSAPGQGSTFLLVVPLLQEGGERVAATKALA
jgi:signal transduction histidine kinase